MRFLLKKTGANYTAQTIPEGAVTGSGVTVEAADQAAALAAAPEAFRLAALAARPLSKLTIRRKLRGMGKEEAFDGFLDANPTAKADWLDATQISAADPMFVEFAPVFKTALGLTDEQFAEITA